MAQHQGTQHLLARNIVGKGKNRHRNGCRDTLITTARVTHNGHHSTTHSCITSATRMCQDIGKERVAKDIFCHTAMEHCTQAVTIVAGERKFRSSNIALCCFAYKLDLFELHLLGKIIDLAE